MPFAWLIHRARTGRDLRTEGSGNPGTTNVLRSTGWGFAALALILESGKGALAVLSAVKLAGPEAGIAAAGGAALGQMFTPWLSGRGGKGVAVTAGAYAVLSPAAAAACTVVFASVLAATRLVSLASVAASALLPPAVWLLCADRRAAAVALGVSVLIAWRHRENFARMRRDEEPRLGGGARRRGDGSG